MQACGAGRPLGRASYVCGCVQLSVPVCTRACPPAMPIAARPPPCLLRRRPPLWESCLNRSLAVEDAAATLYGSREEPLVAAAVPPPRCVPLQQTCSASL